jgi:ABC-type polysaccharide/polyol phosphate export permease
MVVGLVQHRGYIWRNAWAELRNRYAGSIGAGFWSVLQPLLLIGVFTVVFTKIMHRPDRGAAHYVVYLCSALLPWFAVAECINRGTHAFVTGAALLRKLALPEPVFVAQSAAVAAIGLAISYGLLIILAAGLGQTAAWAWVLLPLPLGVLLLTGFGFALGLATLHAFVRDVGHGVPVLLQVGFWSYPVVYNAEDLPASIQRLLPYNPVYPALTATRELFLQGTVPGPELWAGMAGWALAANAFGYSVFHALRRELRDVV